MSKWYVTNSFKKTVETHDLWEKDGMMIRRITVWRTGSWLVETSDDNEPQFDLVGHVWAVDMNCYFENNVVDIQLDELSDGCSDDVIWPDDISSEERERLEQLWEEDPVFAWEEDGWDNTDTECWVYGGFEIERVEQ